MSARWHRESWFLLAVGLLGGGVILVRWAWLASKRGGYEFFSRATWLEIRLYVFAGLAWLVVQLALTFWKRDPASDAGGRDRQ